MKKKGFSLIELLVVIAIIAILTTIVIASLSGARQKSRDTKRISDIAQLQLSLASYQQINGGYPSLLTQLAPSYIAQIPIDPSSGLSYGYATTTLGTYCLGANLEATGTAPVLTNGCTVSCDTTGTSCNYTVSR